MEKTKELIEQIKVEIDVINYEMLQVQKDLEYLERQRTSLNKILIKAEEAVAELDM